MKLSIIITINTLPISLSLSKEIVDDFIHPLPYTPHVLIS